jgi:hypothetical protein
MARGSAGNPYPPARLSCRSNSREKCVCYCSASEKRSNRQSTHSMDCPFGYSNWTIPRRSNPSLRQTAFDALFSLEGNAWAYRWAPSEQA